MDETYDVVIIGGGAAGLGAALPLVRFRRSVLVIDGGDPRNAPAGAVHNLLTRDGTPPARLYELGRGEVEGYGGRVETARADAVRRAGDGFEVDVAGRTVGARKVIVATGLRDVLPDVPGLAEQWGAGVLHCPYCHGWEVRDQRIGVLVTSPVAAHQALLFAALSDAVTVLCGDAADLSAEDRAQFAALGVDVVDDRVVEVMSQQGRLTGVRLACGELLPLDALAVPSRLEARDELTRALGIATVDVEFGGRVIGRRVDADPTGRTGVPGLWVAGNVTDLMAQVVSSAASALAVAAAVNGELVADRSRRALAAVLT